MPVEILELIVKATIEQPQASHTEGAAVSAGETTLDTQSIVEECVAQVMEIFNQQKER